MTTLHQQSPPEGEKSEMKSLKLTLGIYLIGQLVAAIWWASSINLTVGTLVRQVDRLVDKSDAQMADRYGGATAARDWAAQQVVNENLRQRITRLEERK